MFLEPLDRRLLSHMSRLWTLKSENFSDVTITRDHLYETYQILKKLK